jgi:hypothetical protein
MNGMGVTTPHCWGKFVVEAKAAWGDDVAQTFKT